MPYSSMKIISHTKSFKHIRLRVLNQQPDTEFVPAAYKIAGRAGVF